MHQDNSARTFVNLCDSYLHPLNHTPCALPKATFRENQRWQTEEKYRSKKQGFCHIKQVSDGIQNKFGRLKVTDIYYNTVAHFNSTIEIMVSPLFISAEH